MSHVTNTELPIQLTDRDALMKAAKQLGCKVLQNTDAIGYKGRRMVKGEIVLKHDQSKHDVALNKDKNGAYQPSADLWGGDIQKVYGTKENPYGKLVAMYGAEKAKKIAKALGHTVYQTIDQQTGEVKQRVVISQ